MLPYGENSNGIEVRTTEVELKLPLPSEQWVVGLVVMNEQDGDVLVYDDTYGVNHATVVLAGKVRRYEFDHRDRSNIIPIKLISPTSTTGNVYVELE